MTDRPKLSIIVPFYNEEESIRPLYAAIVAAIDPLAIRYEMVFVDDGRFAYGRERDVVQALQQYTLHDKLANDENLGKSKDGWKKWLYDLAPILPQNPDYLKENNFSRADTLNVIDYYLSNQLNHLIENWRGNNYQLIGDGVGRPGSEALHAATALKTPPGSVVPYLHANHIRVAGCRIKFIAAQRPQTGPVTDRRAGKVTDLVETARKFFLKPPQAELPRHTDNRITFWQTVLHENVNVIVDLDDAKSGSQEAHYGPTKRPAADACGLTTSHG